MASNTPKTTTTPTGLVVPAGGKVALQGPTTPKGPQPPSTNMAHKTATNWVWVVCWLLHLQQAGSLPKGHRGHTTTRAAVWAHMGHVPPQYTGMGNGKPGTVGWHTCKTQVGHYNRWAKGHKPKQGPPTNWLATLKLMGVPLPKV